MNWLSLLHSLSFQNSFLCQREVPRRFPAPGFLFSINTQWISDLTTANLQCYNFRSITTLALYFIFHLWRPLWANNCIWGGDLLLFTGAQLRQKQASDLSVKRDNGCLMIPCLMVFPWKHEISGLSELWEWVLVGSHFCLLQELWKPSSSLCLDCLMSLVKKQCKILRTCHRCKLLN